MLRGKGWALTPGTVVPPQPVAPAPVAPTGTANRFSLLLDQSAVAPGVAVTGRALPNGNWPSTSGQTITLNNGTTITLPTSGAAAVTFSFVAGSAGEYSLTATNTAGLYNPYPAPLTVFAASSGAAQAITASLASADQARFQRDAVSGNPSGFSAAWARGWGEVSFTLAQSGPALFVRLHDAASTGATGSPGTGTALTGIVQVHGAFSAAAVRVLLPAGPYIYYADLATDAAFTNPVRVAQRFGVGFVAAIMSRSQEVGFVNSYDDTTVFPQIYGKLATWTATDYRYPADAYSGIVWGLTASTSAGEEFARIMEAQLGVIVGITGVGATGGGMDEYIAHDGSPRSSFDGTVAASVNRKFSVLLLNTGDWGDGGTPADSAYPVETWAEDQGRIQAAVDKIALLYPACSVIRWCTGASGWFGSDGSRDLGYTRVNTIVRALEASNPIVVAGESTLWNEYVNSHASQGARPDYARTAARMVLAAMPAAQGGLGSSNRGPTLAATGTLSGRTIRFVYTLHGGSALTSVKAIYSNPSVTYTTASPAELASLFAVYAGSGTRFGTGQAIKIDSATINSSAGTIDLVLTGTTGITYADGTTATMPSAFTTHYAADFGASNKNVIPGNGVGVSLCDDVSEFAIPYGRLMRPALDIAVS